MLDLDHPRAFGIFAAERQLSVVSEYARMMSVASGPNRRDILRIAEPAIVALRWLATWKFSESPQIPDAISQLETALIKLSRLSPDEGTSAADSGCPACGGSLTVEHYQPPGTGATFPIPQSCEHCLRSVWAALEILQSMESGFGIEAI